jgi:ATP adenylyltransferase
VTGPKSDTCPFCDAPSHTDDESLIVHRGAAAYVLLNRYPYNSGHLLVVPYRHHAALVGLEPDELSEIARLTQRAQAALTAAYDPQGINVGINLGRTAGAGIADHLHVHLVPRWGGDTNFMTVVGETRVLPESLSESGRRLRLAFAGLTGPEA